MATIVPDVIASNQPNSPAVSGKLTLVFDIHFNKKFWLQKQQVRSLTLYRSPARLRDITEHLEPQLLLPSGLGRNLLLQAVCELSVGRKPIIVPLVCEEIWKIILQKYPHSRLKILINEQRSLVITHRRSCHEWLFGRQVKNIDISSYLPSDGLIPDDIFELCCTIFDKRTSVKQSLRKGVWMHLVGVFPPELKAREQRERYIEKLRMVYDSLKGKRKGEESAKMNQLVEAVYRDAVRTDPSHAFYSKDITTTESLSPDSISNIHSQSNVQKLVNIITIYILEHEEVSYTQGMTDLLSPFLFVMKREADAYICFASMLERIKGHFNTWCEGTLLKIERLRHICEVLDPELFHFLTDRIEEDAFALFFGMVLIECRREFSFDDSFQLFEAIWASVICIKGIPPQQSSLSTSESAKFMTNQSKEVIQQVFGETLTPYSAKRLPRSSSGTITVNTTSLSKNPSLNSVESQIDPNQSVLPQVPASHDTSPANQASEDSMSNPSVHSIETYQQTVTVDIEDDVKNTQEFRPRSHTDPNITLNSEDVIVKTESGKQTIGAHLNLSPSHLSTHSRSEGELYDSFSSGKFLINPVKRKIPTEMADLSSVSSNTISASENSHKSALKSGIECSRSATNSPKTSSERSFVLSTESNSLLFSVCHTASEENSPGQNQCSASHSNSPHSRRAITTESMADETHLSIDYRASNTSEPSRNQSPSIIIDDSAYTSDTEAQRSRITPVAFFDVMGTIASSAPENECGDDQNIVPDHNRSRVNSDMSLMVSQFSVGEQGNPRVTRETSLSIPVSDCFPLFVCMSILSQHRVRIMHPSTDFVGLSVVLNTQAGKQNVEKTLYVARDLYRIYKSYQVNFFGEDGQSLNTWLDDDQINDEGNRHVRSAVHQLKYDHKSSAEYPQ